MNKNLHLNLTFSKLNIKETLLSCVRGNLSIFFISKRRNDTISFCGRHARFAHYSSSSQTIISTIFTLDVLVQVNLDYSVVSRGIIFTDTHICSLSVRYIPALKKMLHTFHV